MKLFEALRKKIRERSSAHGYTCDSCGAEIFNYPDPRLCGACLKKLRRAAGCCPKCGRQTVAEGVCLVCKSAAPKFTQGFSSFVYRGETASLVNRVKHGDRRLVRFFGEEMSKTFIARFPACERFRGETAAERLLILPVPATAKKRRLRGYNQAELLAETVRDELDKAGFRTELVQDVLYKKRDTEEQKDLDYASRMRNVAGAYRVRDRVYPKGRTVLLVDDILTTGATGSACAGLLLSAGAKAVYFLTAAALREQKKTSPNDRIP